MRKRTLAVRLGAVGSRVYHALLHVAAIGCLVACVVIDGAGWYAPLSIAALGGVVLSILVARLDGPALNKCLGMTALVELATASRWSWSQW